MATQLPVDTNVKVPAAVLAAAAAADAFYSQPQEGDGVQTTQPQTEAAPEGTAPASSAASTPPQDHASLTSQGSESVDLTKRPNTHELDESSWQHRYNSMKGRWDQANLQIRQMQSQIENLQAVISTLSEKPLNNTPAELRAERLITPEEENDYGPEFLSVVERKAKEAMLPTIQQYEKQIKTLETQLAGVSTSVTMSARERMVEDLSREIPNWEQVNVNPEFMSWLQLPDVFSGHRRHELLKAAYEQNNAPRVLAFFKGFLAEEAAVDPAQQSREPGQVEHTAPKISLHDLAAPGRAKSAAAPAPAEKPSFTRAQISQFYVDKAANKYRGREAEADRIEHQIFVAQREGRIRT